MNEALLHTKKHTNTFNPLICMPSVASYKFTDYYIGSFHKSFSVLANQNGNSKNQTSEIIPEA